MAASHEDPGVRLVCLDFQAKPASESPLSAAETLAVTTEAFPRSLPLDLRAGAVYRALKLFPAGDCVGISHVFDGGAVDEWGRPVLSARVAAPPVSENGWGREVAAVGVALARLEGERASAQAAAASWRRRLPGRILASRDRWQSVVARFGVPFVARLAHGCALGGDILHPQHRYPGSPPTPHPDLRPAAAGLPRANARLHRLHHGRRGGTREIVFLPAPPAAGRRVSGPAPRPARPGDRLVINPATGWRRRARGALDPKRLPPRSPSCWKPSLAGLLLRKRTGWCWSAWRRSGTRHRALLRASKQQQPPELQQRVQELVKKATSR